MHRGINRSHLPSGPAFFHTGVETMRRDADEYDGALRAAASLFVHESHRMLDVTEHVHIPIQGLLTAVRLLEILDLRLSGETDDVYTQRIDAGIREDRREEKRRAARAATVKSPRRKAAKK